MARMVLLFSFEEPTTMQNLAEKITRARFVFDGDKDVQLHMAKADSAAEILEFIEKTKADEESNLVAHAKNELKLLGETDEKFVASIVKAVKGFVSYYGHSGSSAEIAKEYLHKILNHENLSPLTRDPAEWMDRTSMWSTPLWQNKRNSSAFSDNGGLTYWLLDDDPKVLYETKAQASNNA